MEVHTLHPARGSNPGIPPCHRQDRPAYQNYCLTAGRRVRQVDIPAQAVEQQEPVISQLVVLFPVADSGNRSQVVCIEAAVAEAVPTVAYGTALYVSAGF